MAEIADEPDEYLSDEKRGSVSNTKGKGSSKGAVKVHTCFKLIISRIQTLSLN